MYGTCVPVSGRAVAIWESGSGCESEDGNGLSVSLSLSVTFRVCVGVPV